MIDKIMVGVVGYRDPKTGDVVRTEAIFEDETPEHKRARDTMLSFAGQLFGEIMGAHGGI